VPDADELYCPSCYTSDGQLLTAVLKDVSKCNISDGTKQIFNHNGKLVCEDVLPENENSLPEGDYIFDCHGCTVRKGILTCTACLDKNFRRVKSSIPVGGCCLFTLSKKGKLKCQEPGDCYQDTFQDDEDSDEEHSDVLSQGGDTGVLEESREASNTGTFDDRDLHSAPRDPADL